MLNPFTEVNWNPDRAGRRKFGLSLMIGFPIIAAALLLGGHFFKGGWKPGLLWLGGGGFAAGLVLWLVPAIARPFYVAWYFLGCCLGFVVGNVLLALLFYALVTPLGWILRAVGHRFIRKGFDRARPSYWEKAEKVADAKDYYRQF